jgi:hypothetical protein
VKSVRYLEMWKWDHIKILSQRISADVSGVGGAVKGGGGLKRRDESNVQCVSGKDLSQSQ